MSDEPMTPEQIAETWINGNCKDARTWTLAAKDPQATASDVVWSLKNGYSDSSQTAVEYLLFLIPKESEL